MTQVQDLSNRPGDSILRKPAQSILASASGASSAEQLRLFLKQNTFLASLGDAALSTLTRRGHLRRYAAGDVIFRRQDRGDTLMIIVTGLIKITNCNADGKEIVLNFLGSGDTYGEMAVFNGQVRTADAIALQKTEVFSIYARDLLPLLTANPHALLEMLQLLCEKLRAASAAIEDNSLDMRRRVARGLLRLALQHGRTSKKEIRVNLAVSQSELGAYLGLSRENVNRQLAQLRDAGVIRTDGAQIVVTDGVALAEIAEVSLAACAK
jgi:CRP-like cAMP-binding protein